MSVNKLACMVARSSNWASIRTKSNKCEVELWLLATGVANHTPIQNPWSFGFLARALLCPSARHVWLPSPAQRCLLDLGLYEFLAAHMAGKAVGGWPKNDEDCILYQHGLQTETVRARGKRYSIWTKELRAFSPIELLL
jgi:hypothetical protein